MSRPQKRVVALFALFAASVATVVAGHHGYVIVKGGVEIPMQFLGFMLGGVATLGSFGVNIWSGGLLDPRNDPSV